MKKYLRDISLEIMILYPLKSSSLLSGFILAPVHPRPQLIRKYPASMIDLPIIAVKPAVFINHPQLNSPV